MVRRSSNECRTQFVSHRDFVVHPSRGELGVVACQIGLCRVSYFAHSRLIGLAVLRRLNICRVAALRSAPCVLPAHRAYNCRPQRAAHEVSGKVVSFTDRIPAYFVRGSWILPSSVTRIGAQATVHPRSGRLRLDNFRLPIKHLLPSHRDQFLLEDLLGELEKIQIVPMLRGPEARYSLQSSASSDASPSNRNRSHERASISDETSSLSTSSSVPRPLRTI